MNILFCSVGRRGELIREFKASLGGNVTVIAADKSCYAPALYLADKSYLVPPIKDVDYISTIIDICKKENINAVTTFIDPEIEVLAKHRGEFEKRGIEVLAPYEETAAICFDKYVMFQYLKKHGISTVNTYGSLTEFKKACEEGKIQFPVFVKPRIGSGSVGAQKITDMRHLEVVLENDPSLIIQEFMYGVDLDADVYVDTISHQAVSAFSKKKIETKIGGASKTISFKDNKLFELIKKIVSLFKFNGPIDMDFFYQNGQYYLTEVNPRFGGAYLNAYGAGIDFIKLIFNNVNGIENKPDFGNYEEGIVMMMFDSVVIKKEDEIKKYDC